MKRTTIATLVAVCLSLALLCTASATDATASWDAVAHSYSFKTTSEAGPSATFQQAWSPTSFPANFSADFAAIKSAVSGVCGGPIMDPEGDDVMSTSLANWN